MPGMPGAAKPVKQAPKKAKKKGNKVSGNPARRAVTQGPVEQDAQQAAESPFGAAATDDVDLGQAMQDFQLPPELQRMLDQQRKG